MLFTNPALRSSTGLGTTVPESANGCSVAKLPSRLLEARQSLEALLRVPLVSDDFLFASTTSATIRIEQHGRLAGVSASAQAGDSEAQAILGALLVRGIAAQRNLEEGRKCLVLAHRAGFEIPEKCFLQLNQAAAFIRDLGRLPSREALIGIHERLRGIEWPAPIARNQNLENSLLPAAQAGFSSVQQRRVHQILHEDLPLLSADAADPVRAQAALRIGLWCQGRAKAYGTDLAAYADYFIRLSSDLGSREADKILSQPSLRVDMHNQDPALGFALRALSRGHGGMETISDELVLSAAVCGLDAEGLNKRSSLFEALFELKLRAWYQDPVNAARQQDLSDALWQIGKGLITGTVIWPIQGPGMIELKCPVSRDQSRGVRFAELGAALAQLSSDRARRAKSLSALIGRNLLARQQGQ